ncbi:hypothetical protein DQ04_05781030, partial [Trypanosoma grayi]|uniref:hypothetical protein n=1 Tax=Trypanosoma grayi TaxID=71804 RepID=UPI0004F4AF2F
FFFFCLFLNAPARCVAREPAADTTKVWVAKAETAPVAAAAAAMADSHAAYLSVHFSECAPVDGNCVHSPDAVAWSPHNVLLVATQWSLYLHVNGLIASDAVIRPAYPSRGDTSSQMCIAGAKWGLDLVPEEAYPAACRLCVRTTRDLFVYRVIRYGTGRLRVSKGVCFIPKAASNKGGESESTAKRGRKRTRATSNAANTNTTADGDGDGAATTTDQSQAPGVDGPGYCVVSYEWFPQDMLVVVTLGAIFLLDLHGNSTDEEVPQQQLFPDPAYRFSGSAVARLTPSCATRVVGGGAADARLVVASPYCLRIFTIVSKHLWFSHYVEVPALCGVPAALCGMLDNLDSSLLRVFVSAPGCVLHGSVSVAASSKGGAATKMQQAEWNATELWDAVTELGDEISVSRFITIPLGSFAPLVMEAADGDGDVRDAGPDACGDRRGPFLVLGVCQRRLLGFVGQRCITLLRCARVEGAVPPRNVALELSGVAIHPSCTLAVVGVRL